MSEWDTSLGGEQRRFDTTHWTVIAGLQAANPEERRRRLEDLIRRVWKPVYCYIRLQWGRNNEDAKDLTQQFFTWLIDGDAFDRLRHERGRFRSFLKVALRNFLANEAKAQRALKRGGETALSPGSREWPAPSQRWRRSSPRSSRRRSSSRRNR